MKSKGPIAIAMLVCASVVCVFLWPLLDLPESVVRGKQRALLQFALLVVPSALALLVASLWRAGHVSWLGDPHQPHPDTLLFSCTLRC